MMCSFHKSKTKRPRPVIGRGQSARETTCYDVLSSLHSCLSPDMPVPVLLLCRSALLHQLFEAIPSVMPNRDTLPDNGGMPSCPTAFYPIPYIYTFRYVGCERFGLRLRSDLPQSPTCTGLPPSPVRCAFEKSDTVFFNVCIYFYL